MRNSILVSASALFFSLTLSLAHAQSTTPLFAKGVEVFKIQNEKGKTPEFRVLDGGGNESALALAVIATLNAQDEVQPKLPAKNYVDLKVETLKFEPLKRGSNELAVIVKLSGYEIEMNKTVSRDQLVAGKPIEIKFPEKSKTIAIFEINSSGSMKMRYDAKTDTLKLDDVRANMTYESALGDSGKEAIRFTGIGKRVR